MLLVKRDEISLREFTVTRHQFQLERRIEKKQLKNRMKVMKNIISQRLAGFTH